MYLYGKRAAKFLYLFRCTIFLLLQKIPLFAYGEYTSEIEFLIPFPPFKFKSYLTLHYLDNNGSTTLLSNSKRLIVLLASIFENFEHFHGCGLMKFFFQIAYAAKARPKIK
jgi:hypothetical protein